MKPVNTKKASKRGEDRGGLYEQYLICAVRGHNADPMAGATLNASYNSVAKYVCKWCRTTFYTTTTTEHHEENAPKPLKAKETQL